MPYLAEKPRLVPSSEVLRHTVPGWGADLDPADRPALPRERFDLDATGAHWSLPEQQEQRWRRERSLEHLRITPVFGTSCPPKGLSGAVRRYAYARYSEARAAHWLLLMLGDRIDVVESRVQAALTGRPDNPVTESGVLSEARAGGLRSRARRGRADRAHQWMDPILLAAPSAAAGYGIYRLLKRRRH